MKIVFLIFNSNTDQLLVKAHETKFLSPLEFLDQFRIAKFGDLVMPDGEGERLEKPVDNRHHVSPRTTHDKISTAIVPVPSGLVVFDEDSLSANGNGLHNTVDNLGLGVIGNFVQKKER